MSKNAHIPRHPNARAVAARIERRLDLAAPAH